MSHKKSRTYIKEIFLLTILTVLLTGCIGQNRWVWKHPQGYDNQQLQLDIAECEAIAAQEISRYDYFPAYWGPYYDRYFDRRDRRYYYPYYFHYNAHREFNDRNRFYRICMKAKGWKRIKLPPSQAEN